MKNTLILLPAISLAMNLVCGCATPLPATPDPVVIDAVEESFRDIFDGSWHGVTVYIEKNSLVPNTLETAGQNPAVVIDRRSLRKRYEYSDSAPAIAVVNGYRDANGLIHVCINYSPLRMKRHKPVVKGGTFEYTYKTDNGKLIMLSRTKSRE